MNNEYPYCKRAKLRLERFDHSACEWIRADKVENFLQENLVFHDSPLKFVRDLLKNKEEADSGFDYWGVRARLLLRGIDE